jgi:hypothetical protein
LALSNMGECDFSTCVLLDILPFYGRVKGGWKRGQQLKNEKLLNIIIIINHNLKAASTSD